MRYIHSDCCCCKGQFDSLCLALDEQCCAVNWFTALSLCAMTETSTCLSTVPHLGPTFMPKRQIAMLLRLGQALQCSCHCCIRVHLKHNNSGPHHDCKLQRRAGHEAGFFS